MTAVLRPFATPSSPRKSASGAGAEIANQIAALSISPIMIPFIIATLVRVIQCSGTVSMITAASISAPVLAEMEGINMLFAASTATMGSLFAGYFNDSLFHIVTPLMGVFRRRLPGRLVAHW